MLKRTPTEGIDAADVAGRFESWFREQYRPGVSARVVSIGAPEGSGSGDMVWMIDVERESDVIDHVVLRLDAARRRPYGSSFHLQFDVQRCLAAVDVVRVAEVLAVGDSGTWFERDFAVIERLPGRVVPDRPPFTFESWLRDATPAEQEHHWWSAIEAMAAVHRLDLRATGLGFLLNEGAVVGVDQALGWFRELMDATPGNRFRANAEVLWNALSETRPESLGPDALSWGDARLGNVVFDDTGSAALIDFEEVTVTQPEADLGRWLSHDDACSAGLGLARLPGFPSHEETIERYGELLGRPLADMEWWKVYARFCTEALRSSR